MQANDKGGLPQVYTRLEYQSTPGLEVTAPLENGDIMKDKVNYQIQIIQRGSDGRWEWYTKVITPRLMVSPGLWVDYPTYDDARAAAERAIINLDHFDDTSLVEYNMRTFKPASEIIKNEVTS